MVVMVTQISPRKTFTYCCRTSYSSTLNISPIRYFIPILARIKNTRIEILDIYAFVQICISKGYEFLLPVAMDVLMKDFWVERPVEMLAKHWKTRVSHLDKSLYIKLLRDAKPIIAHGKWVTRIKEWITQEAQQVAKNSTDTLMAVIFFYLLFLLSRHVMNCCQSTLFILRTQASIL